MTKSRIHRTDDEGERVVVQVESASVPALVYDVQLYGNGRHYCPCDGHYYRGECSHVEEAYAELAPYEIERRHHNLFGIEYAVIERETGRVVGLRPCYGDAFGDVMDLLGGEAA